MQKSICYKQFTQGNKALSLDIRHTQLLQSSIIMFCDVVLTIMPFHNICEGFLFVIMTFYQCFQIHHNLCVIILNVHSLTRGTCL